MLKLFHFIQLANNLQKLLHPHYSLWPRINKCFVLGLDSVAIQCSLHTQFFQHTVISLQQEVPIYGPLLEGINVLVQLVLFQEGEHCLHGILCSSTL